MSAPLINLSSQVSAALKRRAVSENRSIAEVAHSILRNGLHASTQPWPGFVAVSPARSAELLAQLERDLGSADGLNLSGPLRSEGELIASALARAEEAERAVVAATECVVALERQALAATPLEQRFADAPLMLRTLGLSKPAVADRPAATDLNRAELGEAMRRAIGPAGH